MPVINKQVKHVMSNFPYYLGDCLLIKVTPYADSLFDKVFMIYRVEVIIKGEVGYLDLITNANQGFKGIGGFYRDKTSTHSIAETICESLAVQGYMEEAY